jgi:NADP-dependent 3-hydroxy acid dehydrogenase YdfG
MQEGARAMTEKLDPARFTVLVTGATAGFGAAIARRFAAAGARIIATGRSAERLAALKAELGERCHTLVLDVRDADAVRAAFTTLPAPFDTLDVCVANAGLALGLEPAHQADFEEWRQMIETNCLGLAATIHAVLPAMVARGRGHIVTLGSIAGDHAYPGGNVYGATKAFVKILVQNLRADLAGTGVRATNIEPGLAESEFSVVRFRGDAERAASLYRNANPITPEDVAEAVFWTATLPAHLDIVRIEMMPTSQGFGPTVVKRTE